MRNIGSKYDFSSLSMSQLREEKNRVLIENEDLKKRVNAKVEAMFEKTET